LNNELPVSKGHITCTKTENGTRVEFKMIYPTETDLEKNGNEGGFNNDARGDYALKAFHSADLSLRVLTAILKN